MTTRREFIAQAVGATIAAATGRATGAQRTQGIVQTVQGPIDAAKLGFTQNALRAARAPARRPVSP